jgi:mercuric ion transport protein
MTASPPETKPTANARGASLLAVAGIAAAFGVASCCALPILLTTAGLSAAWLGGIAIHAAPYRALLLWISLFSLLGGAALLLRQQRTAMTCGPDGTCTPSWMRGLLLIGLVVGAVLLWLGYSYV